MLAARSRIANCTAHSGMLCQWLRQQSVHCPYKKLWNPFTPLITRPFFKPVITVPTCRRPPESSEFIPPSMVPNCHKPLTRPQEFMWHTLSQPLLKVDSLLKSPREKVKTRYNFFKSKEKFILFKGLVYYAKENINLFPVKLR